MHNGNHPTAALFPGQGVSLSSAIPLVQEHAPELHASACELIGADPFEHAAASTRYTQPAIFIASIASWRSLGAPPVQAFAGHSLGELSALAAAGAFAVDDALRLAALRGKLMEAAGAPARASESGGMLALLKATPEQAYAIADGWGLAVANDNAPGQLVLSGPRSLLTSAASDAREQGLRAIQLDVAGAFHSSAMEAAQAPLLEALRAVEIGLPSAPVISGLTAKPFENVPLELTLALAGPVRWRQVMRTLADGGIAHFIDVGPDRVLARLAERNLPNAAVIVAEDTVGVGA